MFFFFSLQYGYTEEYELQRGKGSFPAHLTPGYKISKKASELASDVSGHTTSADAVLAPANESPAPDRSSIDRRMSKRLKVKPAPKQPWLKLSTPEKTERTSVRSEVYSTYYWEPLNVCFFLDLGQLILLLHCCINYLFYSVGVNLFLQISYTEEFEHQRGKGSFPAMITPGYYLAKKAQENASDVSINRSVGS